MKRLIMIILLALLALVMVLMVFIPRNSQPQSKPAQKPQEQHLYVTWDVMEFDKCVSAWLITRFIDANAQFMFVPQETDVVAGIPFDVPGALWSRKHQKCTSDCVLESLDINDIAVKKIVEIAHRTELNFWQLDSFEGTRKHFEDVRAIMDQYPKSVECFKNTNVYFDNLYEKLKEK